MNWTSENTQDKIVEIMDKLRKYKVYVLAALVLAVVIIILIPKKESVDIQLKLIGPELVNVYEGEPYEELGFEAYDANNNSYEKEVIIESNLNVNKPGKYQIKYKIGDKEVIRLVIVKPRVYYEIKLEKIDEEETVYLKINDEYKDPGYKIIDNNGEDITAKVEVKIDSKVDVSKGGKYTVTYEFTGPNKEVITAKREVVVIENKLEISVNKEQPTNENVIINIKVVDEYFEYLELPNGEKVEKTEHTYSVDKNGVYKFILHNKRGLNIEEEIEIKNIDNEKPTGSCTATIQNGKTIIYVIANDNIGIKKYVLGKNQYTTNTMILDKEQSDVNIEVYDEAGNKNSIGCEVINKNVQITLTPSTASYINGNINIKAKVESEYFGYMLTPSGDRVYNKNYTYTVSQNGTYKFTVYNKDGQSKSQSITVNNIDREFPTGTCYIKKDKTGIFIEVDARDNIGIGKYIYNNQEYLKNKIQLKSTPTNLQISIYDKANNKTDIRCKNLLAPEINAITNEGVIVKISGSKVSAEISGYYFSYTNVRPNKTTGGYVSTNSQAIDVVRLPGTTYVWVEDVNGNISEPKSISLSNDALLLTGQLSGYTVLRGTTLKNYLDNRAWSLKSFNKLISNSVLAAGYQTKEGAATAGMALQMVLAQKYKIKIPYWMGGKTDSWGASPSWGKYYENPTYPGYNYYGMDCDGFVNWAFKNTGLLYRDILENSYYFWDGLPLSKENGEVGDVIKRTNHVSLIIGVTDDAFIIAEAFGEVEGLVINKHKFTNSTGYSIIKGERLINNYSKISLNDYLAAFQ